MITTNLPNGTPMSLRGFATMAVADVLSDQLFPTEEDRDFVARCCYINLVLAGGAEEYQNDITSILFLVNVDTDTIDFFLEKETAGVYNVVATLTGSTYGTLYGFGFFVDHPFLKGFKLDWASVLSGLGEGNYRIRTDRVTLLGSDSVYTNNFYLKNYSAALADNTIWVEWTQNGQIIDGIDYTGINWYQAARFPGFFGERQADHTEETWKDGNYETWQLRNELNYLYKCEIGVIPACIGKILDNLLQANVTKITDYNRKNYDYNLLQKIVRLSEIQDTKYDNNRQAVYNLTFSDRKEDHVKINC